MSSVSPYSNMLWVTSIIPPTARVQLMVPETCQVYRRRPRVEAWGTRKKYHQKQSCCYKQHVITYSYVCTLEQRRAEKRRHRTHPWIYGSRVGAWLGPFRVLQYSTADGGGGQSPSNRRRSSEPDHLHAWYVRYKDLHRRRKGHARPHPCLSWHTKRITANQASTRSKVGDVGIERTAWSHVCVWKYLVVCERFI